MDKTLHVIRLPSWARREVARALAKAGIEGEDFMRAMNSRLCDLENTIDVEAIVRKERAW